MSQESIELRPAEPEDFVHIQRLHQYAYLCNADTSLGLTPEVMYHHVYGPADDGRPSFGERIMASYQRWMADDESHFAVADVNGVPAGYATVVNYDTLSLLDGLYVDPTLHGRGIGALLLRHAESVAVRPLHLWAVAHAPARDFYKKQGYQETLSRTQVIPIVGGHAMQLVEMRQSNRI